MPCKPAVRSTLRFWLFLALPGANPQLFTLMPFLYYVTADRPSGEPLYLCDSSTQGRNMIPSAFSMAHRFDSRADAKSAIGKTKDGFKGLSNWRVCRSAIIPD